MKNQALFSSKDKSKKSKCRLLQFLFGALRVNCVLISIFSCVRVHSALCDPNCLQPSVHPLGGGATRTFCRLGNYCKQFHCR